MHKLYISLLVIFITTSVQANDCVILLHGLAKSDRDMKKIEAELNVQGFFPVNQDYQSRHSTVEELSKNVIGTSLKKCNGKESIHFVTHSMGGILVRYYLSQNNIPNLGRVVMLGPPNKGSEAVDAYRNFPGFKAISGPAGLQLGTGKLSISNKIGAANFELGIIAGTRSVNLILSAILPGKDDGKVTVDSTKLSGMNDHILLPVTHPFMMKNKSVIQQIMYFLKNGKFNHNNA